MKPMIVRVAARLTLTAAFGAAGFLLAAGTAEAQVRDSTNRVARRLAELQSLGNNVPSNEIIAYEELKRIETELSDLRTSLEELRDEMPEPGRYDSLVSDSRRLLATVRGLDCRSAARDAVDRYADSVRFLSRRVSFAEIGEGADSPWPDPRIMQRSIGCDALRQSVADTTRLIAFVTALRSSVAGERARIEGEQGQLRALEGVLESRRSLLFDAVNRRTAQRNLTDNLWKVIGVLGTLSIFTIAVVRFFDERVQIEWVASGQVIQFVTVMILLSVVMSLGLVGILTENTLGTLLGGVGGYVLSQGVGRAAAREVGRRLGTGDGHSQSNPQGQGSSSGQGQRQSQGANSQDAGTN